MTQRKQWLIRALAGGLTGVGILLVIGVMAGSFSLYGGASFRGLMLVDGEMVLRLGGSEGLAVAVQVLLFLLLGAVVGISTLPFVDDGRSLILRSAAHFAVTAALVSLLAVLNFGLRNLWIYLFLLAAVYLVVWLARWMGWYGEVRQIRRALGLEVGPSPLGWRENGPVLALLGGFFLLARPVLAPFDAADVPLLLDILLPWLLYPLTAAACGFVGGRRNGFCLLIPAAALLCFLPNLLFPNAPYSWIQGVVYAVLALAANAAGAFWKRKKERFE